jgi:hypothetical protein
VTRIRRQVRRFRLRDAGASTVEFMVSLPFVLMILFMSIDFGAVMLRQVFLDRAVEMAVREVRLGNIPSGGIATLRELICDGTLLIHDCPNSLTIELRPINTTTWAGVNDPVECINRADNIVPTLTFNPAAGTQALMLVRVCASADPFLTITGIMLGVGNETGGDLQLVSIGAFVNEPS